MRLLIVRHGDPDYSIDSLTPTGWKEADLLSDRLSKLDVKDFYVSPQGRAKDTAKATLEKMNRTATMCPWLREIDNFVKFPHPEGLTGTFDCLPAAWAVEDDFYDPDKWFDVEPYKTSNIREKIDWVTSSFDQLLAEHGYVRNGRLYNAVHSNRDTLVFFCHFGLECVLLGHLMHVSPMILWHNMYVAPSSVTTIYTEERREGIACFRAASIGDISHLYAAGERPSFAGRFCETFDSTDERHDDLD